MAGILLSSTEKVYILHGVQVIKNDVFNCYHGLLLLYTIIKVIIYNYSLFNAYLG